MSRRTRRIGGRTVALLAAAVAALPALATAAGSDDWTMFRGDPQLAGTAAGDLPPQLEPLWTFQAGTEIESSAAIVGGIVYVGSLDGDLHAVDLESGKPRWKYEAADAIKSSPSVRHGTVYFGDESGLFHAVDAGTGERRWTFQTDGGIVSSANFSGDRVVFGSYDNHLYGLEMKDGSLAWKVETGSYVHGTPAIVKLGDDEAAISTGCDGLLRVVRVRDGEQIRAVELGGYVACSPAVRGVRAVVGTFENQALGVDLESGEILWKYENPDRHFPFYASPALGAELAVLGGRDKLVHAVNTSTGEAAWTLPAGARVDSSPVIVGDRVVVASTAGEIFILDLATGEPVWQFETGSSFLASPSVAGGKLVIGSLDGVLYCFGAARAKPEAPAR